MKIVLLLFFIFIFSIGFSQSQKIARNKVSCITKDSIEYLTFASNNKITFYIKSDLCDFVEYKDTVRHEYLKNEKLYIKHNRAFYYLETNKNYSNSMPEALFKQNNINVLEFSLLSNIGTNGYNYLAFELKKKSIVAFYELDSKKKLNFKKIVELFKNEKQKSHCKFLKRIKKKHDQT